MGATARRGSGARRALSWERWRGPERVLGGAALAVATVGVCVGLLAPSDSLGTAPQPAGPAGADRPAPPGTTPAAGGTPAETRPGDGAPAKGDPPSGDDAPGRRDGADRDGEGGRVLPSAGRSPETPPRPPAPRATAAEPGTTPRPRTPPQAPPEGSTLFGLSVPSAPGETPAQTVARLRREYGGLPVARVLSPALPPVRWDDDPALRALGAGSRVVYSFRADLDRVVAGDLDDRVASFLRSRPRGVRVWVALHHGPEAEVRGGTFTAAQFRAATAHLAPVVRAAGGIPTTILTASTLDGGPRDDWRDFYVGAVDALAWDAYRRGDRGYPDPAALVDPVLAVARETGRPFGVADFGSPCLPGDEDCTGRARWLAAVGARLGRAGAAFVTYGDHTAAFGTTGHGLQDPPSRAAWRRLVSG